MEDKTVLVVDDILHNRLLLINIIKNIGCKVLEARHGREAIDIILKNKVDLIFMDIEMPIMNGFETTEYIRKKMKYPHKYTPIVAVTAAISPQAMGDYQSRGFDDVFYK
ncbi:MAG: response regulator, partial [Bacteroidales bacterium]|nr:response regulator [Bacteroidales bacterium]